MAQKNGKPQGERQFDGVLRRSIDITVRAVDAKSRSVEVIASTDTIDSHGDIVEQTWDLTRYVKNPVVLWAHNNFESSSWAMGGTCEPEDFLPIGHSTDVRVEGNQLLATLVFGSKEYNEMSERVFLGFQEQHIRAVSVAFRPGRITEELVNGKTRFRLGNNELLEISAVPIPSNPDAVAKSIAVEREYLGRMAAHKGVRVTPQETVMNEEQQKAFDAATVEAKSNRERAENAEKALKAMETKAAEDAVKLKTHEERVEKAEAEVARLELDGLQGKKFAPAEREKIDALVKKVGIADVKELLASRAEISVMQPVKVNGKEIAPSQAAPEPTDGSGGNGSADISKAAKAAATAA